MKDYSMEIQANMFAEESTNLTQKQLLKNAFLKGWDAANARRAEVLLSEDEIQKHLCVLGLTVEQIKKLKHFYKVQTGKDIE